MSFENTVKEFFDRYGRDLREHVRGGDVTRL